LELHQVVGGGLGMRRRQKMTSVLQLVGGKTENAKRITDEMDILDNLNVELEGRWARPDSNGQPACPSQPMPDQFAKTRIN
jgi:hypothetical protein